MQGVRVCAFSELPETGSRGADVQHGETTIAVLVVRRGDDIYAYRNQCPHTGVSLDWMPHQFLNAEHTHIQCSNHGALFRIEDGYCIFGPCSGARLEQVVAEVVSGQVKVFLPATE